MKKIFLPILFLVFFITCNKDTQNNKLYGKWILKTEYSNILGTPYDTLYHTTNDNYFDFHSDGKVYVKVFHQSNYLYDTGTFLLHDTTIGITFNQGVYNKYIVDGRIRTLTDSNLTLFLGKNIVPEYTLYFVK